MYPKEIKNELDFYVIKQDKVKEMLAICLFQQLKKLAVHTAEVIGLANEEELKKLEEMDELEELEIDVNEDEEIPLTDFPHNNCLIVGETGTGKSYLVDLLTSMTSLPYVRVDCSRLSSEGYQGENLSAYFQQLKPEENLLLAQHGILILDEFDKIVAMKGNSNAAAYKKMIQQEILSIFEGNKIKIPIGKEKIGADTDTIMFDTKFLLIICMGTFACLKDDKIVEKKVGFGDKPVVSKEDEIVDLADQLIAGGFIPEIVGRIANIQKMEELSEDDLFNILTKTENNLLQIQTGNLQISGINIRFSEKAIRTICKKAIKYKTGARSLRKILNDVINPIIFEWAGLGKYITIEEDLSLTIQDKAWKKLLK